MDTTATTGADPATTEKFAKLEARYQQLRAMMRTLLPDDVYHPDADPIDASVLADVQMIGDEMRVTIAAMEAILCTPKETST